MKVVVLILIPGSKVHESAYDWPPGGCPKGALVFDSWKTKSSGSTSLPNRSITSAALRASFRNYPVHRCGSDSACSPGDSKANGFVREELKPSASVLLNLYPGRTLDPSQIAGIQRSGCRQRTNLSLSGVTLIDQTGAMLSQLKSPLMDAGLDPTQIKYVREIEASAIKRVGDILAPIVGQGNARVQVAADIDFSQSEQTAETHRPNTTPPDVAIRSQQTSESASATPSAQGIPGH